jgi:hypothetical protein
MRLLGPLMSGRSTEVCWRHRQQEARSHGEFVRSGDSVFDVGACTGKVTDVLLGLGCWVAVEPNPLQAATFRKRYGVTAASYGSQ